MRNGENATKMKSSARQLSQRGKTTIQFTKQQLSGKRKKNTVNNDKREGHASTGEVRASSTSKLDNSQSKRSCRRRKREVTVVKRSCRRVPSGSGGT